MGLPDGAAASSGWTYLRGVRRPAEPCGWRAWWPSRAVWRPAPGPRPAHRPVRPVAPGRVERRTHDYVRHGTTTLFAALEVATGHVTDACHPRHRHGEFLGFLKLVARAYPRRQLHVVLDNCGHPQARQGPDLADQPSPNPPALHTDLCVLADLVEVFFAIIERQVLRRGDFASVQELMGWQRSGGSVTAGTSAATRSPGPRTPTRSSPSSSVKPLQHGLLATSRPK
jgi:hypothetical protein